MSKPAERKLGRYVLRREIARGGMATVHLGRLHGPIGFARTVAIKRLHPTYAADPEFVTMFIDEARLASRIHHPNVVPVLDVVSEEGELFLVMEYVAGASLSRLCRGAGPVPPAIGSAIMLGVLQGLHAAHEVVDDLGRPLQIIHRDVSPQNILVGVDGTARVLDFGVAKAAVQLHSTRGHELKGKLAYMAPEQFEDVPIDRSADVYAASVVLWELLAGRRLFEGDSEALLLRQVLTAEYAPLEGVVPGLPTGIDVVLARGLAARDKGRFASADELALALEQCIPPVPAREVARWVRESAGPELDELASEVRAIGHDPETLEPASDVVTAVIPSVEPTTAVRAVPAPAVVSSAGPDTLVSASPDTLPSATPRSSLLGPTRPTPDVSIVPSMPPSSRDTAPRVAPPNVRRWPTMLLWGVGGSCLLVAAIFVGRGAVSLTTSEERSSAPAAVPPETTAMQPAMATASAAVAPPELASSSPAIPSSAASTLPRAAPTTTTAPRPAKPVAPPRAPVDPPSKSSATPALSAKPLPASMSNLPTGRE